MLQNAVPKTAIRTATKTSTIKRSYDATTIAAIWQSDIEIVRQSIEQTTDLLADLAL